MSPPPWIKARAGTVEDVLAAPASPKVGAFFDLDGTLIAGYTTAVFFKHRIRHRQVGIGEFSRTVGLLLRTQAGRAEFGDILRLTAAGWKGRTDSELRELGQTLFDKHLRDRIYPEMRQLVRAHQRQGHTVVLTSSATTYQTGPVAAALGIDHVICSEVTITDGLLSGDIGADNFGPRKSIAVQQFASDHSVDLSASYAYADGDEDAALLHLVGNPRAVNPAGHLAKVAGRRGWPVLRLSSRGGERSVQHIARNIAGTSSVIPAAAVGVAVGLVNRDRRAGVDIAFPMWVDMMLGLNKVKVEVVGASNLWAARPSVFIHNHLTNFDSFVVAKLVRERSSGVGKREILKSPLGALMAWALDAAMIDRSDTAGAIEAMRPVTERLRDGISVVIAPEGTRSETGELLRFKKGAFRMAMSAGVPVTPIVLRNTDILGSRNAATMKPGTVQVAVLPPIPVADWSLADLDERIAAVRQQFVQVLDRWPTTDEQLRRVVLGPPMTDGRGHPDDTRQ
jgi:putative phosphoserine phosphatase/1-acylglycerol-3-phosphate O-acyltransferase